MPKIKLENVSKTYDNRHTVVKGFNIEIKDKEFIVFVGPSGCGKSTTLRMIAGLESISGGEFTVDGQRMNEVEAKNRDIAMVFQNYALYPHMTVYDNIAFGLKLRKVNKEEIDKRVKEAAHILGLTDFLNRKPKALSGGQRQRVALGRAIVRDAKIFLMDEPLSNLDAKLRVQMRAEIMKLHHRLRTTTIYVTHDQTEALTMASRLVVLNQGDIMQIGTPREVYNSPSNLFVAQFIGSPAMTILDATLTEEGVKVGQHIFRFKGNQFQKLKDLGYLNNKVKFGIRPEDIRDEPIFVKANEENKFTAQIEVTELLGSDVMLHFQMHHQNVIAQVDARSNLNIGDQVELAFDMNKCHIFDIESGKNILSDSF
ncbi:ABC transporter ATP-binding protein [Staphylococcus pseudintermedius]|uniref:ABC transporter ATP-binding protein n=4 Tax=Staphylococcus pseudintermedius TaxID=283734 RepID=A0A2P5PHT8_STAPS|nr:sn-glycerol-3-phosphate ABC transporter ATP-binding protein UgpC [Staphylococcus pseudintermedius]EGQ0293045.1 sn-glycerol-3-phosphate ABC transporter ATP-binding protein UgpC [Staphylococcus pseudintermedius]EGQ0308034.1 sn-glycerol-3-phosphate ABC transporter ATP-binding protein UgpC [Staphylococcus pseudintermedius]EGQ0310674.1 sn-glycerol-3-phosphate ABC transporter ATP-binding protein UgpC [Staphylococcus pseudintermedius]EGQ0320551.1 sn-glycerol-3-phosphate ABC transporter ATP-binding 